MERFWELAGAFRETVDPFFEAYGSPKLHYLGCLHEGDLHLVRARLYVGSDADTDLKPTFRFKGVIAGECLLPASKDAVDTVIQSLLDGFLDTPDGRLIVDFDETARSSFIPFHEEGLSGQRKLSVLILEPSQEKTFFQQPEIDWELRAASPPYDTLGELSVEYGLGFPQSRGTIFEVVARQVALVDYNSVVSGRRAEPTVRMKHGLDPAKVTLGIRVLSGGRVVSRFTVPNSEITWADDGQLLVGKAQLEVPEAALIHCIFRYGEVAVHFGYLRDHTQSGNYRRMVAEVFDPQLSTTNEFLFTDPGKGKSVKSGDFEQAVAWLLWSLGFSVAHFGTVPRLTDAMDILATTPMGNMALVECTTGLLKAEHKLANLVARSVRVREALAAADWAHIRLLPVMVTARSRQELAAEINAAEQLGVLVVTRETLSEAFEQRSRMPADADRIYSEAEAYLASKIKPPAEAQ